MKYWLIGAAIMMTISDTAQAETISVTVENIDTNRRGDIMVFIYAKEGFPKRHSKAKAVKVAAANSSTLEFEFDVNLTEYAVKVLHDEDQTREVTKNWTGMVPAEGLGFSNGARLTLTGPPAFRRAKIPGTTKELSIQLKYPRS